MSDRCRKNILRNQLVAHTFATELLHVTFFKMRRDVFQALADPTRRAILMLLAVQAMTPNALAAEFHISRQAISKHIQVLAECEVLNQEQKGREIFYTINADKMKDIEKWLEQFRQLLAKRFDQLDHVLEQIKKGNIK